MEKCYVGSLTDSECHLETYSEKKILHNLSELTEEHILLLKCRLQDDQFDERISIRKICHHHKLRFLDYFSLYKYKCCDPFKRHKKCITQHLRVISLELCENSKKNLSETHSINLIPGDKWCRVCETMIKEIIEQNSDNSQPMDIENAGHEEQNLARDDSTTLSHENSVSGSFPSQSNSSCSYYQSHSQEINVINKILMELNIDPINKFKLSTERLRKRAEGTLLEVLEKLTQKMNNAYDLNITSFKSDITQNLMEDSYALKDIILSLQKKFEQSKTVSEKIQILTVLPLSWQFKQVQQYFDCSNYMFREFKKSKEQNGVLTMKKRKEYWKISDEMRDMIKHYYLDEKNCYICPGIKQYKRKSASGSNPKEIVQKKMLLYTLRDLYSNFVDDYSGMERLPKFSFFASLKPEECVFAGDPGTHEICVCTEHENVKLKLSALKTTMKYRDLFAAAVCNVDEVECMLHRCQKCPGIAGIESLMNEMDMSSSDDLINYKQWDTEGSRAALTNHTEKKEMFLETLCSDVWKLTIHHYIAESQKNYLYHCKNKSECHTCIITMDFSENYSFIIQRSVQSFYYNNTQATVHPFCVYYKDPQATDEEKLEQMSFCVISDTTDHVAYTVHAFQGKLMQIIKDEFPWIKNVIYFSDGAPTQYKNKNNLANVCCHEKDFGIKITSYNFFVTSHGKSVCDGIGGTLKRTVMRHCIRSPPEKQVTTPFEMYEYVSREMKSIRAVWVPHGDVQKHQKKLKKRFDTVKTIKDTRINHSYTLINDNTLGVRVTSFEKNCKVVQRNL